VGDPAGRRRARARRGVTSPLGRIARLVRTVRHLRPRQLAHLGLRRARRQSPPPTEAPRWRPDGAEPVLAALGALGPVGGDAAARTHAQAWLEGRVHGLGLDVPWSGDWTMKGPSPLWRYHLLYHDHLADLAWLAHTEADGPALRALVDALDGFARAWGRGGTPAWDAYPVSVRLVNWMRILAWCGTRLPAETRWALEHGVGVHALHLARNLEWHLDANHLLRDAWAIALARLVVEPGGLPDRLFERILAEQVLADGWHEERSPMYHARAVRDAIELADASAAAGLPLDAATRARIASMTDALPWMLRADGSLWALNDTAQDLGVALGPLVARATSAADGGRHFDDALATVLVDGATGDRLRIDRGGPAPAHQPAHAHAGALAVEWDVGGVPCLVDRGVSGYDGDPWRAWLRSTAAHNTVVVGGRDQSEMWATFRVGGRAVVRTDAREDSAGAFSIRMRCAGWASRNAEHAREVRREGRRLTIEDRVAGAGGMSLEGFLHLHPAWEVERLPDDELRLSHRAATVRCRIEGAAEVTLHRAEREPLRGWHANGFGDVVPAWTIRITPDRTDAVPRWRAILDPT